jgi:hypothetical protein
MVNTIPTAANPRTLEYLRTYYQDMRPQEMGESRKPYERRVYDMLRVLAGRKLVSLSVMIMDISPLIIWHLVWGNLSQAVVNDAIRCMW